MAKNVVLILYETLIRPVMLYRLDANYPEIIKVRNSRDVTVETTGAIQSVRSHNGN